MTTIFLFQITIAKAHEIKSVGLIELLKSLPKTRKNIFFIFVVPAECAEDYSQRQRIPDSQSISPNGDNLIVRQFRLVFWEDAMQKVVIDGQATMQEDLDESDEFDSD